MHMMSLSFILLVFKYNVNFIYKLKIGELANSFPQIQYIVWITSYESPAKSMSLNSQLVE